MNYYETLGVSPTATPQEIKDSFRRIAMKTHPDRNQGNETYSIRFNQAKEAYQILSDAKKREEYDRGQLSNLIEDPFQAAKAVWNKFIDEALEIPTKQTEFQ